MISAYLTVTKKKTVLFTQHKGVFHPVWTCRWAIDWSYSPNYSWPWSFSSLPGKNTAVGLSWNLPKLGYSHCYTTQRFCCWSVALKRILVEVTTKMNSFSSESFLTLIWWEENIGLKKKSMLLVSLTSFICNLFHPFWLFCYSCCVVRLCWPWCGLQCIQSQMPPSTARGRRNHLHQRWLLFSVPIRQIQRMM